MGHIFQKQNFRIFLNFGSEKKFVDHDAKIHLSISTMVFEEKRHEMTRVKLKNRNPSPPGNRPVAAYDIRVEFFQAPQRYFERVFYIYIFRNLSIYNETKKKFE